MKHQEWTFIDKSEWKRRGPWDSEPDKVQWRDETTGLPCLIVRNRLGTLCGYVGVSKDHPFYRVDYNKCPKNECAEKYCGHDPACVLRVHGGLTFSDVCQPVHPGEESEHRICHVVEDGEDDNVWWLGFDTGHYHDLVPGMSYGSWDGIYRDIAYVTSECADLAAQLAEIQRSNNEQH